MSAAWIAGLNHGAALWAGAMACACWQGAIALALAGTLCRAWPGLPPQTRCWLWRLAYLKLLIALFWATPVDLPLLPASTAPATAAPVSSRAVETTAAETRSPPSRTEESSVSTGRLRVSAAVVSTAWHRSAAGGLMLLWLLGVGACGVRYAQGWREMRSRLSACELVDDGGLNLSCAALCRRLGVRRPPRLLTMQDTGSPFLTGALRPAITLPASLLSECSAAALELMLAHELGHLKRHDLRWAWLPTLARGLFWFHPLVWLAGAEWRLAQEMACDELTVRVTNAPPGDYGAVLLQVAAQSRARVTGGLITVGILESYHTLQRRLMAMKSIGQASTRRIAVIGATLAALGVLGLIPWQITAQASRTGSAATDKAGQESLVHLERLGIALQMYAQDYDETLPPMQTPAAVKKALYLYVRKNDVVFLDPRTSQPYEPNPSLSGKAVGTVGRYVRPAGGKQARYILVIKTQIPRRSETIGLYEPIPAPDGTRGVLFLDGHVARVSEAEWKRLKKASGIP